MKKLYNISAVLLLFIFMFSCNSNKQESIKYNIVKLDSISIYFPDTIPFKDVPSSWDYKDSIFSFLTDDQNSIRFYKYNIYDGKWQSLTMKKEGKNGVLNSGSYEILNHDKLYYIPKYTNKIFLINTGSGEILKTFTINEDKGVYQAKNFNLKKKNNYLILPVFSKEKIDREYFKKNQLFAIFNLSSNHLKSIVNYPPDFLDFHAPSSSNIGVEFYHKKDSIIYCFPRDEHIYFYDLDTDKTTKLAVKNPKLHFSGAIVDENPYTEAIRRELEGMYSLLLYDSIRGQTYRISTYYSRYNGKLPRDQEELNSMFQSRKTNIIVLNSKFETIASNDLESVTNALFFINKEGLYMRSMFEGESEYRFVRLGLEMKDSL